MSMPRTRLTTLDSGLLASAFPEVVRLALLLWSTTPALHWAIQEETLFALYCRLVMSASFPSRGLSAVMKAQHGRLSDRCFLEAV